MLFDNSSCVYATNYQFKKGFTMKKDCDKILISNIKFQQ